MEGPSCRTIWTVPLACLTDFLAESPLRLNLSCLPVGSLGDMGEVW